MLPTNGEGIYPARAIEKIYIVQTPMVGALRQRLIQSVAGVRLAAYRATADDSGRALPAHRPVQLEQPDPVKHCKFKE